VDRRTDQHTIKTRAPHNGCQRSAVGAILNKWKFVRIFFFVVTVTLTFDLVTQKWVWRVELIKMHLHMKFQSCRWKHFDVRAKCQGFSTTRTADEELAMTIPRVFSKNSRAKNYVPAFRHKNSSLFLMHVIHNISPI
jgi:hypothetical protein